MTAVHYLLFFTTFLICTACICIIDAAICRHLKQRKQKDESYHEYLQLLCTVSDLRREREVLRQKVNRIDIQQEQLTKLIKRRK
jgi:hypothetical protein